MISPPGAYKIRDIDTPIVLTPGHSFMVPSSIATPPGLSLGTPGEMKSFTKSAPKTVAGLLHTQAFQCNSLAVGRHQQPLLC